MTTPIEPAKRHDHWRVSVETSGELIVAIEPEMLAGREPSEADYDAIRTAANHLLAFAGDQTAPAEVVGLDDNTKAEIMARQIWAYFKGGSDAARWFDNNKSLGGPSHIIALCQAFQTITRDDATPTQAEAKEAGIREAYHKVALSAKEFIDDWTKGDFSLSTLAALDAQSLDNALTALSALLTEGEAAK